MTNVVSSVTIVLVPLTLFFISGCAFPITQSEIEEDVAAIRENESSRAPEQWVTSANTQEIQVAWIDTFKDPLLVNLVEEALTNNRNLQAAAAGVERAQALAGRAGATLSPTVDLTAGANRSGTGNSAVSDSTDLDIGLRFGWELDLWGRIRAGVRAAEADADAAAADYRYARESLAAGTAKAYITAVAAHLQTATAQDTVEILEEILRIVKVKKKNDAASGQDVALATSDLANARDHLITVEGSQRDALRALGILLGRYPSADIKLRQALPDAPPSPPAGIPSELLERRPDLLAAERKVAAAFNVVAEAKAARLPALSLTGNAGGASSKLNDLLRPEQTAWQLGANLLVPLVDGGARKAEERVATAQQKEALASYGQAALAAFNDVESLLDQGAVRRTREVELRVARDSAREAFRIANLRHKEGESELLDVLSIQQRLASAESNLILIQRLLLEQRVNLYLALGGSWSNNTADDE